MSKQPEEHVVVIYDLTNSKGEVVSTHSCYDSDIENVAVPEGFRLSKRDPIINANQITREVNYAVPRAEEYPGFGDQLDVIWKMFAANPTLLTPEAKAMLDKINAIKQTYVKGKTYVNNQGDPEGNAYVPKT